MEYKGYIIYEDRDESGTFYYAVKSSKIFTDTFISIERAKQGIDLQEAYYNETQNI